MRAKFIQRTWLDGVSFAAPHGSHAIGGASVSETWMPVHASANVWDGLSGGAEFDREAALQVAKILFSKVKLGLRSLNGATARFFDPLFVHHSGVLDIGTLFDTIDIRSVVCCDSLQACL
jgi:hypothetical protein